MKDSLKIEGYELLSKKIYRILKSQIIKGVIKPGEKLLENKLAEQMGISRTPVREAIRQLAAEGFVKINPNQGIIVNNISLKDLMEVLQIHSALESLAARLLAPLITEDVIKQLETFNKNMEKWVSEKNVAAFATESDKFHSTILNACGNSRLVQIRKNLSEQIYRFREISLNIPGRLKSALKEHIAITNALKDKNADRASTLSMQHINNVIKNISKETEL